MSKLDVAREKIAYLKLALGIMVVTDIGLMSRLLTGSDAAPAWKFWGAVFSVMMITAALFEVHRQIMRRINGLEKL